MDADRRRRTRVSLQLSATVAVGNEAIPVQTWNVSLRGMGCTPDRRFRAGCPCRVRCVLGFGAEFVIDGTIVRCSETEAAIFFISMDEEAFFHLKRLVQSNTENPDAIDRELAEPL